MREWFLIKRQVPDIFSQLSRWVVHCSKTWVGDDPLGCKMQYVGDSCHPGLYLTKAREDFAYKEAKKGFQIRFL